MFLALGLFVSSLVKSQLVAWMLALLLGLLFVLPAVLALVVRKWNAWVFACLFCQRSGTFSAEFYTRPTRYPAAGPLCDCDAFCLFMTVRSLETRRSR